MKNKLSNQSVPPVVMQQQSSVCVYFFPHPMKHFDPIRNVLPDCQSEIICCKKVDRDNLVKFDLDLIQGLIIANDWRVVSLHAKKLWSSKVELVENKKWTGLFFTNLHVNFAGTSLEPLIPTRNNTQEVVNLLCI